MTLYATPDREGGWAIHLVDGPERAYVGRLMLKRYVVGFAELLGCGVIWQ